MIFYICIIGPNANLQSGCIADYAKAAINAHSTIGSKPPNILNEPCMFIAITNKAGVKKCNVTENDHVRLSVNGLGNYNHFNIEGFSLVKEIYDEMKTLKFNIDPNVAYA